MPISRRSALRRRGVGATTSPGWTVSETSSSTRWAPNDLEMLLKSKSGIDASFEVLRQQRERPAYDEIECRHDRVNDHRLEGGVGHQLTRAGQLDEADDGGDR